MSKVIVVDDSDFLVNQMVRFLEDSGFEVLGVGSDGFEGFQLYKEYRPDFITLDLTMPNCDGRECLKRILEFDSAAKVLIVSALSERKIILECMDYGAKAFQEKPLLFQDPSFCSSFLETINGVLSENS